MSDLRSASRVRSLLGARIVFNNRFSTVDCVVRDISASGAKLLVTGANMLPEEFELEIPQKGRKHRVRLVWRRGDVCGVQFLESAAA
jgi:hypothetical protein